MRKKISKNNVYIILILMGFLFLNGLVLNNPLQSWLNKVFTHPGLWIIEKYKYFTVIKGGIFNAAETIEENNRLRTENMLLLSQLVSFENTKKENELLRKQLDVEIKKENKLLLAKIFGINKTFTSSTLMINKGIESGVKQGSAVITAGNILVGIIKETNNGSSLILLLDDPRLSVDVKINSKNIISRTKGILNNSFRLELVSQTEEISNNTLIATAGLGGIDEGLLVGEVNNIDNSDGLFQNILAKPFFDISYGSNVFVILNNE